ncbi:MAG TPA: type 4a pilus biogenesis protein PilO [Kofleriaceae bacterium]|nr:type 4a pilus biogenesis protein PilO [Kofleriaceae bacterium]
MAAQTGVMADFARMPTGRKVLVFAVIGLVLGLLYFRFFYKPLQADERAAKAEWEQKAAENSKLAGDIPKFKDLRAKKQLLDDTIREQQKALPTGAEVPAFFETLERKVTEAGVDVIKWNKKPEEAVEGFVKVPLDVEIQGTFMQIKRFFASLVEKKKPEVLVPGQEQQPEERERIVSIENLALTDPVVRNREIILTAKFTAVTFRQGDAPAAAPTAPGTVPPNSPPPSAPSTVPGAPPMPTVGSNAPPALPSADTPAGAKARVEDSMKKDEQRVQDGTTPPPPAGSGSAPAGSATGSNRLQGGL